MEGWCTRSAVTPRQYLRSSYTHMPPHCYSHVQRIAASNCSAWIHSTLFTRELFISPPYLLPLYLISTSPFSPSSHFLLHLLPVSSSSLSPLHLYYLPTCSSSSPPCHIPCLSTSSLLLPSLLHLNSFFIPSPLPFPL